MLKYRHLMVHIWEVTDHMVYRRICVFWTFKYISMHTLLIGGCTSSHLSVSNTRSNVQKDLSKEYNQLATICDKVVVRPYYYINSNVMVVIECTKL